MLRPGADSTDSTHAGCTSTCPALNGMALQVCPTSAINNLCSSLNPLHNICGTLELQLSKLLVLYSNNQTKGLNK